MKLSDYKNEEALDILADIIEPASEIFSDKKIVDLLRKDEAPMKAIKIAIKDHKKSVMEILAILDGVKPDEYECNVFTLPMKVLEVLNDEELLKFFTLQGQMME